MATKKTKKIKAYMMCGSTGIPIEFDDEESYRALHHLKEMRGG
jgi:hypothetical protein